MNSRVRSALIQEVSLVEFFGSFGLSESAWMLALVAAMCLGMSKTAISGVSLIGIALMAEVWPARASTGIILPMLVFGDLFAVTFYNRHALWSEVLRVLPPALVGVIIGFFLFRLLPAGTFAPIIGWTILFLVLLQTLQTVNRLGSNPGKSFIVHSWQRTLFFWSLGVMAGITTMLANASGPVMTIYLLAAGLAKYEFMGTSSWVFFLLNLCKLPFSYALGLINGHSLTFNLLLLPAIAFGALLGKWLLTIIPQKWFERILLLSAALAALRLIWR